MINISKITVDKEKTKKGHWISLCGKLEAMIGHYYLFGVVPDSDVETLYYDASVGIYDSVELIEKNIVAYYIERERIGFVKSEISEKLKKETEEYDILYITVDDFYQEVLCVDISNIPEYLKKIVWIDDDFMADDTIPFDFDAFAIIESKVSYLNPKHFSVSQLIRALKNCN